MQNTAIKAFDKLNKQSDADKLSNKISYTFFFLLNFTIITISAIFSIAINNPKTSSNDLFIFASLLSPQPVTERSVALIVLTKVVVNVVDVSRVAFINFDGEIF